MISIGWSNEGDSWQCCDVVRRNLSSSCILSNRTILVFPETRTGFNRNYLPCDLYRETHIYVHIHTHTHTLTHSLTHTHTHIHTHTHTHTHTLTQIWSSATGIPQLHCRGIIHSKGDSILCVNLSEDNSRVAASATSGMIMVRTPNRVSYWIFCWRLGGGDLFGIVNQRM